MRRLVLLAAALLACAHSPSRQERDQAEIRYNLGTEALRAGRTQDALKEYDEALRLYPPIVAISRAAVGPDDLAGTRIARGTIVVVAPYVLHRHRLLWDRPDLFDPNRFLGSAGAKIDRFAYLPFGVGARICIGAAFALQEATLVLARIVKNFTPELRLGHAVWPLHRVTLKPKGGLPMVLRTRA